MRQINLLPEEIAALRRRRQTNVLLVVLFLVFLVVLAGVWFFQQGRLNREQQDLEDAQARVAELETQVAALQEFALLDQIVRQKEATLATAMVNDIAWSRLLIELSMIIPGDSWITTFNGTAAPPAAQPTPGVAPAFGSLTFSAVTFDFPGVAMWITRLQELQSIQNIWVPSAAKGTIGAREVVNFSSTTDLSGQSTSGRYQVEGGAQ